jgi:hypothetical protein
MAKSTSSTTRRGFLGAVASAAPLAIASTAAAAATSGTPSPDEYPPHNEVNAAADCYDCRACRDDKKRRRNHPLHVAAAVVAFRALCALEDLAETHNCEEDGCEHYCSLVYQSTNMVPVLQACVADPLAGALLHDPVVEAAEHAYCKVASTNRPPFEADFLDEAGVAMADLLEALDRLDEAPDWSKDARQYVDIEAAIFVTAHFAECIHSRVPGNSRAFGRLGKALRGDAT